MERIRKQVKGAAFHDVTETTLQSSWSFPKIKMKLYKWEHISYSSFSSPLLNKLRLQRKFHHVIESLSFVPISEALILTHINFKSVCLFHTHMHGCTHTHIACNAKGRANRDLKNSNSMVFFFLKLSSLCSLHYLSFFNGKLFRN